MVQLVLGVARVFVITINAVVYRGILLLFSYCTVLLTHTIILIFLALFQ